MNRRIKMSNREKCADKIDFVVTWVDGNDPVWQEAKSRYVEAGADIRAARYRDWDQLKYWFRAIEKNAPWVNKIHFVTFGHLPKWLNTDNQKLHIVKHEDFIPKEFLPVFNSTAIEVHLHRIPRLSENFVYFNDDMFIMKSCKPTHFFKKGKPVDMAQLTPIPENSEGELYYYHLYNDYSIYRKYFSKGVFLRHFYKYCNIKYCGGAISNLLNIACKNLYFSSMHFSRPYRKSSFETVWRDYEDILLKTAKSRFRIYSNNSPQLFRGYELITGNFHPERIKGIVLDTRKVDIAKNVIESGKYRLLCLSDNTLDDTFETDKEKINASFEKVFPSKCSYERAEPDNTHG